MITRRALGSLLALLVMQTSLSSGRSVELPWRTAAERVLGARSDPDSLATAAALTFVGSVPRTKADAARAAAEAAGIAARAAGAAPEDPAINWLRLLICANAPGCDMRDAATTQRWVDADNGAVWLPTLAAAQREHDVVQVERVLADMAEAPRFDLYVNRTAVRMYDALTRVRSQLPSAYLKSDLSRLTEALGLANATVVPPFSPLLNACREAAPGEPREDCLRLSKTMQRADAVLAQLVGFAIEKRLCPNDPRELRLIAERRRVLEWRVATAGQADTPLLPWLRNASARARLAKMRVMPREEDVYVALLRAHHMPLEPPEERR